MFTWSECDIRGLKKTYDDDNGNENVRVHHRFSYFFRPSLHDHDVTLPNLTFCAGREHVRQRFSFSYFFFKLDTAFRIQLKKNHKCLTN